MKHKNHNLTPSLLSTSESSLLDLSCHLDLSFHLINLTDYKMPRKFLHSYIPWLFHQMSLHPILVKKKKNLKLPITIVFVSKFQIQTINNKYRKKNKPTDILSFSLGELILCPEIINLQAQENHHSFRQELSYLLIHGCLHLLGYDHKTSTLKKRKEGHEMMKIQDEIFFKNPFRS